MKHSLKKECLRRLRTTFGLTDYRPGQKAAVETLLSGRDVMCILPTGAGKSLCWQLPAVVHAGLTVVVSPLIALMRDQVEHLAAIGIPAVTLDSLLSPEEKDAAVARLIKREVHIVFVSPERLEQDRFRRLCQELCPWLVVVDEAHCVVQWGEHFRPSYGHIRQFLSVLSIRPVLCALTATADDAMQDAICESLGMRRTKRILLPILRENLVYDVRTTLDRTGEILRLMQQSPCRTVIFCRTRSRTERLAQMLAASGLKAEHYHAGLERAGRIDVQQRFLAGEKDVLCATSAFGLGVDIPDVRRVIHDHLPDSLIDYVQQSGRAGRDGQTAECILLIEPNDLVGKAVLRSKARDRFRGRPIRRWMYLRPLWKRLDQLLKAVLQADCIPAAFTAAFGKPAPPCGQCSACRKGRLVSQAPSLAHMREWQIRAWLLLWQRKALARSRGCVPQEIVSDRAIRIAAKKFVFPQDAFVPEELERLAAHFRQKTMHEDRP